MIKSEYIDIKKIRVNEKNPRLIKDEKFKILVNSIKDFPQMLDLRPIVVNKDMMILGGNQRYEACIVSGISQVPVIIANNLTPEQEKEFIIKDNIPFGEWDFDILANEWELDLLIDWGMDMPVLTDIDYSDKNEEIDTDEFSDKMILKIELSEENYHEAVDILKGIHEDMGTSLMEVLRDRS